MQPVRKEQETLTEADLVQRVSAREAEEQSRNSLTILEWTEMHRAYLLSIQELWELRYGKQTGPEREAERMAFFEERLSEDYASYFYFPRTGKFVRILPRAEFEEVHYSRLYPLISHEEQERLKEGRLLSIGASTASGVIEHLGKLGCPMTIVDFDEISSSNTTRMANATQVSVGKNKAVNIAQYVVELNPYTSVTAYTRALSMEEMAELGQQHTVTLEMCDDGKTKVVVRQHANVIMGTGLYNSPPTLVTEKGDASFATVASGNFIRPGDEVRTPREQAMLQGIRRFVVFMGGGERIPTRHKVNFILYGLGRMPYLAQEPITTGLTSAMLALQIKDTLCGHGPEPGEYVLSMEGLRNEHGVYRSDRALLKELAQTYPDIFSSPNRGSLETQVTRLWNELSLG